ncbi:sigma-70 family RNA polymerase sigma factor [Desulfotomaculum copahuensis]|uniref:Flagellar biosynthesis protein FliA n=1 Tax=Desulfotomaculum copahuensis TaxID=1838280 RepID=A0A1B7LBR0_9FIRM|nr:FliA/WhiG family RNA polymerase sigma factor [Desulfotomaculum copahuensis]OAT79918.1 flagellar biosynthesis protein FliA [Desulfotomaculum copahuensis]
MDKDLLWQQFRQNKSQELRHQLVLSYLWLVKHLAGRLAVRLPACISQEDLESCGVFGLIEAVDKFDPDMGRDFESYAYARVRGAMLDEVRRANWIPRTMWHKLQLLKATREKLERKHHQAVTNEAVAREMGVSTAEINRLDNHFQRIYTLSLDEMVTASGGETLRLGDLIPDPASPDPLDKVAEDDNQRLLAQAVAAMSEKDQLVLSLYYRERLTMKEIGLVIGVTESRVCQLHSRALNRLRQKLKEMEETK